LSGATTKRPALLRFLKAFEDGDTLIVWKLDRLGRMTGHGFRGLASTILHEQGYAHEHIELQLAHAPRNAVSAAYNHALYLEPRAKMMRDWADFLERTQRGSKVLLFGGTAA
jgi:integrase